MRKESLFLRPALLALVLLGCLKPERTTGGSVEENEILAGILVTPSGRPVADATVELYSVDHIPGRTTMAKRGRTADSAFTTRTDAAGRYAFDSLPMGRYNILAVKEGARAFRDSVPVTEGARVSVRDTLRTPGSLRGVVGLQPQHSPRTATVHVLGTQVFVNVDAAGRFALEGLAQGRYRLRLETTEDGYTPTFAEADVAAGEDRTLPDTLHLAYTGIPVVEGIEARLDTLAGVVRVGWRAVDYSGFGTYMVYRDARDAADPARNSIGLTGDTVFLDTLYRPRLDGYGLVSQQFPPPQPVTYRVKVRNRALTPGEAFHAADLDAVPPSWVKTFVETRILGVPGGEAGRGDTVRVVAAFRNRTRALARVRWFVRGAPARTFDLPGRPLEAGDTLWVVGDEAGSVPVEARIFDEAGDSAAAAATLSFVVAPPVADAGADTLVWRGAEVRLRGRADSRFRSIRALEWDVGATGRFAASPDGTAAFAAPDSFATVLCVLRATDTDGETGLDTVAVTVGEAWEKVTGALPFPGTLARVAHFQGRLWLVGGKAGAHPSPGSLFSTSDGRTWVEEPATPGVTDRLNHAVFSIGGRLWIAAGEDRRTGQDYRDIWSSADGRTWTRHDAQAPFDFTGGNALHLSRIWVAPEFSHGISYATPNGHEWETYRTNLDLPDFNGTGFTFGAFGGRLVLAGGRYQGLYSWPAYGNLLTSEDGKAWRQAAIGAAMERTGHSMVAETGRLWVIGGADPAGRALATTAYSVGDPHNWRYGPAFTEPVGAGNVSFSLGGTVWVIHEGTLWRLR